MRRRRLDGIDANTATAQGLRLDQAKRFKELEKETARLKKIVAEQALDNAILKEAASGNF